LLTLSVLHLDSNHIASFSFTNAVQPITKSQKTLCFSKYSLFNIWFFATHSSAKQRGSLSEKYA